MDGETFISSNKFDVTAGQYTYYVKDANECLFSATAEITQNAVLEIGATSLPSCFEKSNGGITISANGGAGGYEYTVWSFLFLLFHPINLSKDWFQYPIKWLVR